MTAVHITLGQIMGAGAHVFAPVPRAVQALASGGTSAASTITANDGDYACIAAYGGDVLISIGPSPVAATGTGYRIAAGTRMEFGPLKAGDGIAVIDAPA